MNLISEPENKKNKLTQEELDKILSDHEAWLNTKWYYKLVPLLKKLWYREIREFINKLLGRGVDLSNRDISGLKLSTTNLKKANLRGANLTKLSNLQSNSPLQSIDFSEADLTNANLSENNFIKADFTKAKLNGTVFRQVKLEKVLFLNTKIENCDYSDSQIVWALFAPLKARKVNFTGWTTFDRYVKLYKVDFIRTEFIDINEKGPKFIRTKMVDVDFSHAKFSAHTKFIGSKIKKTKFDSAKFEEQKIFIDTKIKESSFKNTNVAIDKLIKDVVIKDIITNNYLSGAIIKANLSKQKFTKVDFKETSFVGADLTETKFLYCEFSSEEIQTDSSLFSETEFKNQKKKATVLRYRIRNYINKLHNDDVKDEIKNFINDRDVDDINWLNNILEVTELYEWLAKGKIDFITKDISEIRDRTIECRKKTFETLSEKWKIDIRRLNRLLIEKKFPKEAPKSNIYKCATFENVKMNDKTAFLDSFLCGVDFENYDLSNVKFDNSNCKEANFNSAKLTETSFRNANLEGANLNTKETFEIDLGGANLFNAELGYHIQDKGFKERIKVIEESARNTRTLFLVLIASSVFALITTINTISLDLNFVRNKTIATIPYVGVNVSGNISVLLGFILFSGLWWYFQFYWKKMAKLCSLLPARFRDGKRLDEKIYPWLLADNIIEYMPQLKLNNDDNRALHSIQYMIGFVLGWIMPIIVLVSMFFMSLKSHHSFYIIFIGIVISVVLMYSVLNNVFKAYSYPPDKKGSSLDIQKVSLHKKDTYVYRLVKLITRLIARFLGLVVRLFVRPYIPFVVFVFILFGGYLLYKNKIEFLEYYKPVYKINASRVDIGENYDKYSVGIDGDGKLTDKSIIEKLVYVDMKGAKLDYADVSEAKMVKLDLNGADFTKADLKYSVMAGSDLRDVTFDGAEVEGADFSAAIIDKNNGSSDFSVDEFEKQGKDISKLCHAINQDGYKLPEVKASAKTIEWLNEILQHIDLYKQIIDKKQIVLTDVSKNKIGKLNGQIEKDNDKEAIKGRNRLIIELAYLQETPKKNNEQHGLLSVLNYNLSKCRFRYTDLSDMQFESKNGQEINLRETDFSHATLTNIIFEKVEAVGSIFDYAKLENTSFNDSNLSSSVFKNATLTNAKFEKVEATGSTFDYAKLENTYFNGADLSKSHFRGEAGTKTIFNNVKFNDADFEGFDFKNSYLKSVAWNNANVFNANFEGVEILEVEKIKEAKWWKLAWYKNETMKIFYNEEIPAESKKYFINKKNIEEELKNYFKEQNSIATDSEINSKVRIELKKRTDRYKFLNERKPIAYPTKPTNEETVCKGCDVKLIRP